AEDGIRDKLVTGVQTCALPISRTGTYERGVALFHRGGKRRRSGLTPNRPESLVGRSTAGTRRRVVPLEHGQDARLVSHSRLAPEIGRASCRERVEVMVLGVGFK